LASQLWLAVWWPLRERLNIACVQLTVKFTQKTRSHMFFSSYGVGMQMWSNPKRASINLSQEKSREKVFFYFSLSFLKFRMWCQRNSLRFYYFMACFDLTANHHRVHGNLCWNHIWLLSSIIFKIFRGVKLLITFFFKKKSYWTLHSKFLKFITFEPIYYFQIFNIYLYSYKSSVSTPMLNVRFHLPRIFTYF
jgi:hypothetical protein